jgi:hypothetical protein
LKSRCIIRSGFIQTGYGISAFFQKADVFSKWLLYHVPLKLAFSTSDYRTRTRTNTNPTGTEASAAADAYARALRASQDYHVEFYVPYFQKICEALAISKVRLSETPQSKASASSKVPLS